MESNHTAWKIALVLIFFLAACTGGLLLAFSSGPPAARTGDFGEPSCNAIGCHSGNAVNEPGGSLTITGVPAQYAPGQTYPVSVQISRGGQQRWGFELAVRTVAGIQAGNIVLTDLVNTQLVTVSGIQYVMHTTTGTAPGSPGGSWTFNWVAPSVPAGTVRFSAAGNAANGNFASSGDFIYTTTAASAAPATLPITAGFAQVAIGGGWTTRITLLNTGGDPVSGTLFLTASDGTPLEALLSAGGSPPVTAASFPVNLQPGGSTVISADAAIAGTPTRTGWARVESAGGELDGVSTFRLFEGGALKTVAGVLASELDSEATIPVDDDGSVPRFTGYAVVNPGPDPINIRLILVDEAGAVVQSLSPPLLNPLGPGRHVARFLWQDLDNINLVFRGTMVLSAQGGANISVIALVEDRGLFTAIPVATKKAPHIP